MLKIHFYPVDSVFEVESETKVLLAARRNKVAIRFGCAAARCGTCAVAVSPSTAFDTPKDTERDLLIRMRLPVDGTVRLSCQARILGDCSVDITFQDTYSPDNELE